MSDATSPQGPFRERLDAFTRHPDRLYDGDADALHRTRVASRRLRELLPVLGLKANVARKLNRRLEKVTKGLGTVRELDVLALLIQELGRDPRYASTALTLVAAEVDQTRDAARKHLAAKLPLAKLKRLARRLERAMEDRHPKNGGRARREAGAKQAWLWALDARTTRRATRLRNALDGAGALYDPVHLHEVRIALKKLRYASELAVEAQQRRTTADLEVLKGAQELLGRLRDLQVLIEHARGVEASLSPPSLTTSRELESLVRALEEDCRTLHARYVHERAKLIAIADRTPGARALGGVVSRRAAG